MVLKSQLNSHNKMAGFCGMQTAGELRLFCDEDSANDGPLSKASDKFEDGFGVELEVDEEVE